MLEQRIAETKLVVCLGAGGVGKTTTAAAIALTAARCGRRTLVMTVDPAKRLADVLGLDGGAAGDVRAVPETEGRLDAVMLDTKSSFDALIGRIAPDAQKREQILSNRVYQAFSRSLSRSHAYAAMEQLYEFERSGAYDLIVLDTPPAASVQELLNAPQNLGRFLNDKLVRLFISTKGSVARALASVTGDTLVNELVGFLSMFVDMRDGFVTRAAHTQELLSGALYVLVTSSHTGDASQVTRVASWLKQNKHTPHLVVNRAFVPEPGSWEPILPAGDSSSAAAHAVRQRMLRQNSVTMERCRALAAETGLSFTGLPWVPSGDLKMLSGFLLSPS